MLSYAHSAASTCCCVNMLLHGRAGRNWQSRLETSWTALGAIISSSWHHVFESCQGKEQAVLLCTSRHEHLLLSDNAAVLLAGCPVVVRGEPNCQPVAAR